MNDFPAQSKKSFETIKKTYNSRIEPLFVRTIQDLSRFDRFFLEHKRDEFYGHVAFAELWKNQIEEHSNLTLSLRWWKLRSRPQSKLKIDIELVISFQMWQYTINCKIPEFENQEKLYDEPLYDIEVKEVSSFIGDYIYNNIIQEIEGV